MFRTLNTMFTGSESKEQPFQYYLVLDFESTCQEGTKIDPQEIIEFPCLLIRTPDFVLVDQVVMNNFFFTFDFLAPVPRIHQACSPPSVDEVLHRSHWNHSGHDSGEQWSSWSCVNNRFV